MSADRAKVPVDYDTDPSRRKQTVRASQRYLLTEDVYGDVARHFERAGAEHVLDVGCGEGLLQPHIEAIGADYMGIDSSVEQLKGAPPNRIFADARDLPFEDDSFDGVAALYMLYHFDEPEVVIKECHRVLSRGGILISCASSYRDMPELSPVFELDGPQIRSTFDAESGVDLVKNVFGNVRVDSWDGPYIELQDAAALTDYCRAMGASQEAAVRAPGLITTPLRITKRGALHIARKDSSARCS